MPRVMRPPGRPIPTSCSCGWLRSVLRAIVPGIAPPGTVRPHIRLPGILRTSLRPTQVQNRSRRRVKRRVSSFGWRARRNPVWPNRRSIWSPLRRPCTGSTLPRSSARLSACCGRQGCWLTGAMASARFRPIVTPSLRTFTMRSMFIGRPNARSSRRAMARSNHRFQRSRRRRSGCKSNGMRRKCFPTWRPGPPASVPGVQQEAIRWRPTNRNCGDAWGASPRRVTWPLHLTVVRVPSGAK